jgi:hypothetical protein
VKYLFSSLFIVSIIVISIYGGNSKVGATSENIVLLQLQTSSNTSASEEIILLFNTLDIPVDVSGWCVNYSSSTDVTKKKLSCVETLDSKTRIYVDSKGVISFSSGEFVLANPGFVPDFSFTSGIAAASGHVWLTDEMGVTVDRIGWGSAVNPEEMSTTAHNIGETISRNYLDLVIDTDNNFSDFVSLPLISPIVSGLYEEEIMIDVCSNIDGLQLEPPSDYLIGDDGLCVVDFCLNLADLQIESPDGYEKILGSDDCTLIQLEDSVLLITELLANATSSDTGKEFIEIYNPNNREIELKGYKIQVGPSFTKEFEILSGVIKPNEYVVYADTESKIVLPNSNGVQLRLVAPAGNVVFETPIYNSASDDVSWALVEDNWIYTNQVTPAAINSPYLEPSEDEIIGVTTVLAPCPVGKYRNPETNRCRKVSVLGVSTVDIPTITDVSVENTSGQINWLVIFMALLGTFGYILYEWRTELSHSYSRMRTKLVQ